MKMLSSRDLLPSLPSLIDRFFEGDLMDWGNENFAGMNSTLPAVNVKETDSQFQIEVAAPGMKRDDFKVKYDNGRLVISSDGILHIILPKKEELKPKPAKEIAIS